MRRRDRGGIFVLSLAVLAGLIAIFASVAATQRTALRSELNRLEAIKARTAAHAALQHAMAVLADQAANTTATSGSANTANNPNATTLQDDWALLGDTGGTQYALDSGSYRVQIVDALSLLNINFATQTTLQQMNLTDEQIDSLLDYREAGETARPNGGKDSYYNNLTNPYNAKLATLDTLDELLNVKGFTASTIYQPQTGTVNTAVQTVNNQDPPALYDLTTAYGYTPITNSTGQAKLNVNAPGTNLQALTQRGIDQASATGIAAQKNWTSIGQLCGRFGNNPTTLRNILDNLTVGGASRVQGRLNLNTVTENVLNTLSQLTPDVVQGILSRQQQGFTTLSDILQVPGLNSAQSLVNTADLFTVVSQSFIVRVVGKSGNHTYAMEATVDVQNGTPKIIRITDAPFTNMISRWGWPTETKSTTSMVGNQ